MSHSLRYHTRLHRGDDGTLSIPNGGGCLTVGGTPLFSTTVATIATVATTVTTTVATTVATVAALVLAGLAQRALELGERLCRAWSIFTPCECTTYRGPHRAAPLGQPTPRGAAGAAARRGGLYNPRAV